MGTFIGLAGLAVGAAIVVALGVVAVRSVGPFVDGTALFRAGPRNAPPGGGQEEDPPRWDFGAMRAGGEAGDGAAEQATDPSVEPPQRPT